MPLSRRYTPEWAPGDSATIGMDFSAVLPPGVGITEGLLTILTNTATPQNVTGVDFTSPGFNPATSQISATVTGRTVYCDMAGGVSGRDYQLQWIAIDTDDNSFIRTALMLCAPTS